MQPPECSYGEHQVLVRLWSSWTLVAHTWGHKPSTRRKRCRAYLWKSSPGIPGHRGLTPAVHPTHVGTQTYCSPSRCIKWGPAGSQLSLGPSLLQWKIPPGAGASQVWLALSTCSLSTLSQGSSPPQGQFGPRGLWASEDISGWQHREGVVLWHPVGGSQGYCSTSSRA